VTILLIDDSDNERAMIRKMLEAGGHDVREASGCDDALSLFGALGPALVLCDLMMPLKDGFATIAELQARAPDTKIIAMSGVWFGETDRDGMANSLGLVAVIEKPFSRAQLLSVVAQTLDPGAIPARATATKNPKPKPKRKAAAKPKKRANSKMAAKPKVAKRKPAKAGKKPRKRATRL
jgi:CheY-like chemotaxis protein